MLFTSSFDWKWQCSTKSSDDGSGYCWKHSTLALEALLIFSISPPFIFIIHLIFSLFKILRKKRFLRKALQCHATPLANFNFAFSLHTNVCFSFLYGLVDVDILLLYSFSSSSRLQLYSTRSLVDLFSVHVPLYYVSVCLVLGLDRSKKWKGRECVNRAKTQDMKMMMVVIIIDKPVS